MKDLLLFDVDNTLTISRGSITDEMSECLKELSKKYDIGCVSGSDLCKMKEQLGNTVNFLNWKFTENGLVTYYESQPTPYSKTSLIDYIGEEQYQKLINTVLILLGRIELPVKRGNFIELRTGLVNICPIGRSCTQKEREDFFEYDKVHNIRKNLCNTLSPMFPELKFSIGGQISIDVFPKDWNKTYCLQFINSHYDKIYFFGDNIKEGGNDYEIGIHPRVIPKKVSCWQDTLELLKQM